MLILDNPTTWPVHVIDQLNSNKVVQLCKSQDYMEHIAEHPDLIDIFADVEKFAISDGIAGYHCTKQPSNVSFKSIGLRSLDFARHHAEVRALIRQHPSVDDELYGHIDSKLTDWQYNHTGDRENKLWFCMTRTLVLDSGTDLFFKYFGGESVYFPFLDDKSVIPILESIGKPVVVEANINPADLFVFQWC